LNPISGIGFFIISPQLKYKLFDYLNLGLNYSYIELKVNNSAAGRSELNFQHRVELEANPKFKLGDWVTFTNRNRIEFRWIENKASHNTRYRSKVGISFPLKDKTPIKKLKAIYADTEGFYNAAGKRYEEQRTVPFGLVFNIHKNMDLKIYYMLQAKAGTNQSNWSNNEIFGTHIDFKF